MAEDHPKQPGMKQDGNVSHIAAAFQPDKKGARTEGTVHDGPAALSEAASTAGSTRWGVLSQHHLPLGHEDTKSMEGTHHAGTVHRLKVR